MNKATWKYYYRLLRIARREANKACVDLMVYGTGILRVGDDGIEHIPYEEKYLKESL